MPDTIQDAAKKALKKSGKLNMDPAAYTAGYLEGVKAAKAVVLEALEKYGGETK
jgi:hypothetical protein